ncbi:hypothetical protein GCM10009836_11940 [Pseudonocardia ailaonensis]|uniref:SnoaL-like domain-containing protein n=1 Tax=Pseudonocardia ailaonensis TaxID=367279 RepID=A0ABN2MRI7_9PSEU
MSDWVRDFYATLDALDLAAFLARFTDDAVLVLGNQPPAVGKDQITGVLGGMFAALSGLHHEYRAVHEVPGGAVCELTVTFTLHDGAQVTVPAMDALDRGPDGRITAMRVAVDLAPLMARLAPA